MNPFNTDSAITSAWDRVAALTLLWTDWLVVAALVVAAVSIGGFWRYRRARKIAQREQDADIATGDSLSGETQWDLRTAHRDADAMRQTTILDRVAGSIARIEQTVDRGRFDQERLGTEITAFGQAFKSEWQKLKLDIDKAGTQFAIFETKIDSLCSAVAKLSEAMWPATAEAGARPAPPRPSVNYSAEIANIVQDLHEG